MLVFSIATSSSCQTIIIDPVIKEYNSVKLDGSRMLNRELNVTGYVVVKLLVKDAQMDSFWISRINFNSFNCANEADCLAYNHKDMLISCLKNHLDAHLKIQPIDKTSKEEIYLLMVKITNQD